ncbi:VPS35 endosomal protein sorting factor-like [Camellia lanceoleosa]|uniref:VPS35 endosomal protein sorting factor-like n=1 Tax=Camellia lanceoleosa TaxID=1840588 RepID=A0ACC0G8H0_9ERIC|nr:VPS35 endosomal protein sorting factor-like [Camellia lanceoleosa]
MDYQICSFRCQLWEYVSRLHELKDEVARAWKADDRVTSLKVSIKVARLLTDTSVLQFYPTLFVLATDVMNMLNNMVWQRINQKAEFAEGEKLLFASLANIESIWLKGNGRFLLGSSQPSVADLSLVCEIMQLEVCGITTALSRNGQLVNYC